MINSNEGRISFFGTGAELLADLTCIVKGICKNMTEDFGMSRKEVEEMIGYSVSLGITEAIEGDEGDGK